MRVGLVAAALFAVCLPAAAQTFVFHLRGDQEVPPVPSAASGGCQGDLNQPASTFAITCVHDVAGATVMHIHQGAAGVNGAIVFDLGDPSSSPVTATWTSMTPANIADLLAGNLYVNIHSPGRPSGEIRGQILSRTVDLVAFTADGAQVVPPSATAATANCVADLDGPATSLAIQCTHNLAAPTAAHVHQAPFGVNGPTVFTFPSAVSPLNANVPMTPTLVASFAATFLSVDIHSATEEVRGQIGTPPPPPPGTIVIEKLTSPTGGAGFGFTENIPGGTGTFTLNHAATQTFANVTPGTYTVTENDPAASNYTLGDVSCDDADSTGDVNTRAATITVGAGETVRCTFRNIATRATDQLFVFHLSGDQAAPPVATNERGGCMGRFDAGASALTFVCTHDVAAATLAHVHRGAAGVSGPIVFDLGTPTSPLITTWSGMTPADVADLLAGNFYLDIHNASRVIRGQLLARTVDTVAFPVDASQVVPPGGSAASANCTADLSNSADTLAINCTHNLAAPTAAHVHQAPSGAIGPIAFAFPSPASPMTADMPMTPRLVADFAAAFLYLDIHAVAEDIRGQIGSFADLVVTKSGPATIVAGNDVSYNVSVANVAASPAESVTLIDPLPVGTTFVSVTQNSGPAFNCTAPGGDVTCTLATLASGTSADFTIVYQVPAATAGGTIITNTATATSTTAELAPATNTDSVSTTVSASNVDLSVTKTASAAPHAPGQAVTYIITVSNAGPSPAATVTVTDTLPPGTSFVSATPSQGSCSGTSTVTCTLGTIASGGSATVSLVLTLPATPGTVINTASATTSSPEADATNNSGTSTITVIAPASVDLSVTKTASPAPYAPGQPVTYTITVSNAGPSPAAAVTVTDILPMGTAFVSATPSQGTCSGTSTVSCVLGTIASGGSATVSLVLTLPITPGPVMNSASATTSTSDANATNNSGTSTITVIAPAVVLPIPALTPLTWLLLAMLLPLTAMTRRRG